MSAPVYAPEAFVDGTMADSAKALADAVVGHRIVSAERVMAGEGYWQSDRLVLTLDSGQRVELFEEADCCAYTALEAFLLSPELVDHVITGVATTDGYTKWHVYADLGDVLALTVGWSEGSGYYAYGFDIRVTDLAT